MIKHQGGANTPQGIHPITVLKRSTKRRPSKFIDEDIDALLGTQKLHISNRKVREIVTVSGRGVREYFPSYKGRLLKAESLIEEDMLRVCEVAASVSVLVTQPCVLEISNGSNIFRYTPDALVTINGKNYFVEVKPRIFRKKSKTVERLHQIAQHMRLKRAPFIIITDDDVRANGLQEKLKLLLRLRPQPGKFDSTLDTSLWDPRGKNTVSPEVRQRWHAAQEECDALLQRVMRRNPDSYIETA